MKTPNLNRRVQIQTQTTTQDSAGQPRATWTTQYTCWAAIDIQQSQLLYSTAEFIEHVAYRITIRWTKSFVVQPNMRLIYTEPSTGIVHTYNVEAVINPQAGNVWVTVLAYELDGAE